MGGRGTKVSGSRGGGVRGRGRGGSKAKACGPTGPHVKGRAQFAFKYDRPK